MENVSRDDERRLNNAAAYKTLLSVRDGITAIRQTLCEVPTIRHENVSRTTEADLLDSAMQGLDRAFASVVKLRRLLER